MTKWASPEEVVAASERWTDQVKSCRTYGHRWMPHSVVRDRNGYIVTQQCSSCKSRRVQNMSLRGYAEPWRYQYENRYLTNKVGRIGEDGKAYLRLAIISKMKITEVSDQT